MREKRVGKTRPDAKALVAMGVKQFVSMNVTKAFYGTAWGTVVLEPDVSGVWKPVGGGTMPSLIDLNTATVEPEARSRNTFPAA